LVVVFAVFLSQIYDVFQHLPGTVQVCLFSATMPEDILEISQRFMRDPVRILVKRDELTLEGIKSVISTQHQRTTARNVLPHM